MWQWIEKGKLKIKQQKDLKEVEKHTIIHFSIIIFWSGLCRIYLFILFKADFNVVQTSTFTAALLVWTNLRQCAHAGSSAFFLSDCV